MHEKYTSNEDIDSYLKKIENGSFFNEFDTVKDDNCIPYNFTENETLSIKVSSGLKNALKQKIKASLLGGFILVLIKTWYFYYRIIDF